MIRSIRKPVLPADVDFALPHEHVLHNIGNIVARTSINRDLEIRLEDLIDYRRAPFAHGGRNMLLQQEDEAFRELERLQQLSSTERAIVVLDVTLPAEGRDALVKERLELAARLKQVHLLTVTTVDTATINDILAMQESIEAKIERIATKLETELMFGIKSEGVVAYPGAMYQQICVQSKEITAFEQILGHGLARAQARTQAPVYLSYSSSEEIALVDYKHMIRAWFRLLIEAGAARKKLVLCHADRWCQGRLERADYAFLRELLDRGISILFDAIGLLAVSEVLPINPCHASTLPLMMTLDWKDPQPPSDTCLASWVATLIQAKPQYILQILLSTNVQQRIQYRRYGGGGYTYLFEYFKARLLHEGVSAGQWEQIVCKNVIDLLAWYVPPEAPPIPKDFRQCTICSHDFEPIEGDYFTKFTFTYCSTKCLRHHSRLKFAPLPTKSLD